MDIYIGVLVNAALVVTGSLLGLAFRRVQKIQNIGERVFEGFGFFVMVMGIQGVNLDHPLYFLFCMIIGTAIGELIDIDKQFNRFGAFIERKFARDALGWNFAEGFITASLLYCIGSMTFLGAIQSGIDHEHTIYITKGVLDGVSALTMSMGSGISVAFSAISVIVYQGILTSFASIIAPVLSAETVGMCVSVGSLSLIAIGCNIIGITKIKVANFLPAMFIPMIWQAIQLFTK